MTKATLINYLSAIPNDADIIGIDMQRGIIDVRYSFPEQFLIETSEFEVRGDK